MSFATAADEPRSERFYLARITPARIVSDSLASAGGGIYTLTWTLPIARVERNGVALTETTTNPPGSNDQWYHDEDTGSFKVKLASAPNTTTNIVCVFYYLFYTSRAELAAPETPTDSSTPMRPWEPRLAEPPRLRQSVSGAISGRFEIALSSIQLVNEDRAFEAFTSANDSLHEKDVVVWTAIESVAAIQKVFTGKIRAFSTGPKVTLEVFDTFAGLTRPCMMSDTVAKAFYRRETGSFPSMDPARNGAPIPFVIGKNSRHDLKSFEQSLIMYDLDFNTLIDCVCTSYSQGATTSTNRTWGVARTTSAGFKTLDFGTAGSLPWFFEATVGSQTIYNYDRNNNNLEVGDTFSFTSGGTIYARVIASGTSGYLLVNSSDTGLAAPSAYNINSCPAIVVVQDGIEYFPFAGRDFSVTTTALASGNIYQSITFVNNFEASVGMTRALTPSFGDKVYARTSTSTTSTSWSKHGQVLKRLCEDAGISVNATSFSDADTALDVKCRFQIPQLDETEVGTALSYAQLIVESTLGYLYVNNDGEAVYKLVSAPSPTDTLDENLILAQTDVAARVDYNDVVTQIVADNPHCNSSERSATSSTPTYTLESTRSLYLHHGGKLKSVPLRHVLETIDGRLTTHLAVRSRPKIIYQFSTATEHLDATINQDLTLNHDGALGGTGTVPLKIVSLDKALDDTVVEATPFEGV
jgi:hypothetical protein